MSGNQYMQQQPCVLGCDIAVGIPSAQTVIFVSVRMVILNPNDLPRRMTAVESKYH